MSNKPVGEVRPSQVITTFGPGAIVDCQGRSKSRPPWRRKTRPSGS